MYYKWAGEAQGGDRREGPCYLRSMSSPEHATSRTNGRLRRSPAVASVPAVVAGALAVAVAAQVSVPVPGSPVPQSLQTLAVVVVGGSLGWRRGVVALLAYVAMGVAGLPVFADGGAGVARLAGPTGGYLAGFVAGAGVAGWWVRWGRAGAGVPARTLQGSAGRGWVGTFLAVATGFVVTHVIILALGWMRLASVVGPGPAWGEGVEPFLWGGLVKALVGAGGLVGWWRWRGSRTPVEPDPRAV